MMMRSTPPRSENLAEMPVPAPAPMIGSPALTRARRRPSESSRAINGIRAPCETGEKLLRHRVSECGIVDVEVELDERHGWSDSSANRVEQCGVGFGIVKLLPRSVQRTDALQGKEQRRRRRRLVQLARDDLAELTAFIGRRAHERDVRIVHVELAVV